MKRVLFVLSGVIAAFIASVGINATTVPTNMYVEQGTHSCVVTWDDEDNSAWNLRYRLYSEEPELISSIAGTDFSGTQTYYDVTLPAPWAGNNLRGASNRAIYFRQKGYQGATLEGMITYTIPDDYDNMTFTLKITTDNTSDGTGNLTVATPQTAATGHNFSAGETFSWLVTASAGEKITITSTKNNYSPDIARIEVYTGDATGAKGRANAWTYVNNLNKTTYTIEDLEIDTEYEVQVQAIGDDGTLSDWTRPDVFTTLAEEPFIPSVHILGDINDNQAWSPDAGTKMEYDPETELYTATIFVWAGNTFGFSTELDMDGISWNNLIPYRFGPVCENRFLELTDDIMGQAMPLSFASGYGDLKVLSSGEYEVTVSLEQNYVIIGKIGEPVQVHMKGDANHDGSVSVIDVSIIIDSLLGSTVNLCEVCADVNEDNVVSVVDVSLLIDMLLSAN